MTKLLNESLLDYLRNLSFSTESLLQPAGYDAWAFCTDGSCSGDCVGDCTGTAAGHSM